ncbi:MAG: hypothetical protein ACRD2W_06285 [Acidimicrobiales bacterium]
MRQVALARAAIVNDFVDEAAVALCAPWGNRSIWRRWTEARAALAGAGAGMRDIPADAVVGLGDPASGSELGERYRLGAHDPDVHATLAEIVDLLNEWAPQGMAVENPDAGEGYTEILSIVIEHDPWMSSQLVLRCHVGFHDYPYALTTPLHLDRRPGGTALRVLSSGRPRWLFAGSHLRHAGAIREPLPPVRIENDFRGIEPVPSRELEE